MSSINESDKKITRLELLKEVQDMVNHNLLCYSKDYFMNNYYKGFYGINIFPVNIWNKLYRRSFLEAYSEPPITGFYNEDLSYNLHVMPNAKKIVLIAEKLYYYRWGGFTTKRISSLLDTAIN